MSTTAACRHLFIHAADGDLFFAEVLRGNGDVRQVALAATREVVAKLRDALEGLVLVLRADDGSACPELHDLCEEHHIEASRCRSWQRSTSERLFGVGSRWLLEEGTGGRRLWGAAGVVFRRASASRGQERARVFWAG